MGVVIGIGTIIRNSERQKEKIQEKCWIGLIASTDIDIVPPNIYAVKKTNEPKQKI